MKTRIEQITVLLESDKKNIDLYMERAMLHYKSSNLKAAYNDFVDVLYIDSKNIKAKRYADIIDNIFSFEYRENYNV
ncbi:MAG: hypothetical protein RR277_05330 [Rikenellaceae bacterium]